MVTREAMEQSKTLDSSLYHAPTLRQGIGSPRCPRCSAPLSKDLESSGWTIAPFVRESFAMVGTAVGGTLSSFYAFNAVMPHVKKRVGGPIWWQFVVGVVYYLVLLNYQCLLITLPLHHHTPRSLLSPWELRKGGPVSQCRSPQVKILQQLASIRRANSIPPLITSLAF
nr:uncharacterized protein LOC112277780 isoform X2 [Physcomitrium patens]|eukprot:XP_024366262.1 uncharacterized protein LOC112277780 isoform X2 [Physcomitrella patens]